MNYLKNDDRDQFFRKSLSNEIWNNLFLSLNNYYLFIIDIKQRVIKGLYFNATKCHFKALVMKENLTLLFRQCLPNQGMEYKEANCRIFNYFYAEGLTEADESRTTFILIHNKQRVSEKKLNDAKVFVHQNKKFLKENKDWLFLDTRSV